MTRVACPRKPASSLRSRAASRRPSGLLAASVAVAVSIDTTFDTRPGQFTGGTGITGGTRK